MDIVCPIIHSNGDTAKTLIENLEAQYDALGEAIHAIKEGAPNGRNYYVIPGLLEKALAQHMTRLKVLADMQDDIVKELKGIQAQCKAQKGVRA